MTRELTVLGNRYAVFNHCPNLFDRAEEAARCEQGVTTAMLVVAALEALPHDLAAWYGLIHKDWGRLVAKTRSFKQERVAVSRPLVCSATERRLLLMLTRLERKKAPSARKFDAIHRFFHRRAWNEAGELYKDFLLLINVRNAIVHPKSLELSSATKNGKVSGNISGHPSFIDTLVLKRVIRRPEGFSSWINALDNNEFCEWCLNTAGNFIHATLDLLPESPCSRMFKEKSKII